MKNDTIVAIATPLSESGIGIVRISGADAFAVADRVILTRSIFFLMKRLTQAAKPMVSKKL